MGEPKMSIRPIASKPTTTMRLADGASRAMPRRLNFTRARLDALKVPAGKDRIYVFDEQTPALAFVVTAAGGTAYYLYKRVKGRPVRYRLADGAIPVDRARMLAIEKLALIGAGQDVQAHRIAERQQMTVEKLFEHWKAVEGAKKRSIDQYKSTFDRYAGPISARQINAVYQQDVARLHADIGREAGHYAANRMLAILSIIFRWASNHLAIPNPVKGIKKFPEYARERFVQPDELDAFLEAIESEPDPTWKDYWRMLLNTGQRRSNVAAMRWPDVDLQSKVWRIPAKDIKGKKPLTVPLSEEALTVLTARHQVRDAQSDFVFPSHGASGHVVEPKAAWGRLLLRAGIDDLRMHDVRRTVGSYMAMSGASDRLIGGALGQTTQQATNVYARLRAEPIRQAMLVGLSSLHAANDAAKAARKK